MIAPERKPRLTASRRFAVAGALVALYAALFVFFDGLRFPLRGDERHFWATALQFSRHAVPPLELLRSYRELNTPLPFLLWGLLEHTLHQGVWLARFGNLLLSAAMLWVIVRPGAPGAMNRRVLAAVGVLLCPYYLALSTHAYTDIIATFFTLLGIHWHLNSRYVPGGVAFVLAIAARQYMVAFPAALVVWELLERARGRSDRDSAWLAPACAAASLGGWYLFFGNFGPQVEVAAYGSYIPPVWSLNPGNALYLLACTGVYFTLPRVVLFREKPEWHRLLSFGNALILAALLLIFLFFPPINNPGHVVPTMGYFDRALRFAGLGDFPRVAVFFVCALIAVVGVKRQSLALSLLLVNAGVMLKAHTAWDKYVLPLIVVLWYLEARAGIGDSVDQHPTCRRAADSGQDQDSGRYTKARRL